MMQEAGFWIEENVISVKECENIIAALSRTVRSRAGARHLMADPTIEALARDPRLMRIARSALGEGAVPFRATLFEKSANANWLVVWHQDTALPLEQRFDLPGWSSWSTKGGILYAHAPAWALARILALRVHLDECTSDNGPLRIIPGSHARGMLSDDEVFRLTRTQETVECLVRRGGVLAMRPLLLHSSPKVRSQEPRRVIHIEYAESLELDMKTRLAIA